MAAPQSKRESHLLPDIVVVVEEVVEVDEVEVVKVDAVVVGGFVVVVRRVVVVDEVVEVVVDVGDNAPLATLSTDSIPPTKRAEGIRRSNARRKPIITMSRAINASSLPTMIKGLVRHYLTKTAFIGDRVFLIKNEVKMRWLKHQWGRE